MLGLEGAEAHDKLSELSNSFVFCHFPADDCFLIYVTSHPRPGRTCRESTFRTKQSISQYVSCFDCLGMNWRPRRRYFYPDLRAGERQLWSQGGSLTLSNTGRASYHQQKVLPGLEDLPPIPVALVSKDGILLFPATEIRGLVEYPSMLDVGVHA